MTRIYSDFLVKSPIGSNISYFWGIGSILGMSLVIQIITGILLAFHYIGYSNIAFKEVENIMREELQGWLIRYVHSNGASLFFIAVYIHIGRNLYYGSYTEPRSLLWNIGVTIYIVMMATAFLGYVLPWGSMSFWGASVITSFLTVIPFVGNKLVEYIWGGFSIESPTLTRFYALHFTLPFVITAIVFLHLIALHDHGSNNPISISSTSNKIVFHPYLTYKDIVGFLLYAIVFISLVGFLPNILGHSDNYIEANPLVTPPSIVPEFYFLPFYAILRSIPNKTLGVLGMLGSILILYALPYINFNHFRSSHNKPFSRILFWSFVGNFLVLLIIGASPVEQPYVTIGQFCSVFYFASYTIIHAIINIKEFHYATNFNFLIIPTEKYNKL